MKITIQSPDFKANDELISLVNEKIEKLGRFSDRILESRALLKIDKSDTRDNKIVEIKLIIPGNDLFVSARSTTFEKAVAEGILAMKRQVKDWKERLDN